MKYNRLGHSGLVVSELSFGSWVTFDTGVSAGTVGGDTLEKATELCYEIMVAAYKGGVNFFDNAEIYASGVAERLMGRVVRRGIDNKVWTREDLVLSTKIMHGALPPRRRDDYIAGRMIYNRVGLSRKHVFEGLTASLKRMKLDYVDLVLCHRPDPLTPIEEVVRAFNHVLDQGLAFYWGTSEWSAAQLLAAKAVADRLGLVPPLLEQPEYSLLCRDRVEREYRPLYARDALGLGLTTFSPLGGGLLTGKYYQEGEGVHIPSSSRLASPAFTRRKDYQQRFLDPIEHAEALRPLAGRLQCSMAQLALAWCMTNPDVSTVLTGATSVSQVQDNLGACAIAEKMRNDPSLREKVTEAMSFPHFAPQRDEVAEQVRYRLRNLSKGALAKL